MRGFAAWACRFTGILLQPCRFESRSLAHLLKVFFWFFFPSSVNLSNINQYQLGQLQSLKLDRTVLLL